MRSVGGKRLAKDSGGEREINRPHTYTLKKRGGGAGRGRGRTMNHALVSRLENVELPLLPRETLNGEETDEELAF